jgi:hypothetical protein
MPLIADGFNSFQPTVGQIRSVTVKAKGFYGMLDVLGWCAWLVRLASTDLP